MPSITRIIRSCTTIAVVALSLAELPSASAQQPAPTTRPAWNAETRHIFTLPPLVKVVDYGVSADNLHVALALKSEDGRFRVVVDGVQSPEYEWVAGRSIVLSQAAGRFAYQVQHDNLSFIVVGKAGEKWDAAEGPGFYTIGSSLFSPDGQRFAYVGQKSRQSKRMTVVLDGVAWPELEQIVESDMQFSPDSKRLAVRAKAGEKQFYVIDGVAGPQFDSVAAFVFSGDGSRYAYAARIDKQWMYVIDGRQTAKYSLAAGMTFTPDGKRYAYVTEPATPDSKPSDKQQLVYNDGTGEKLFQPVDGIGLVALSPPDGRRLAMAMKASEKKWTVVIDGKPSALYDGAGTIHFSADGKRVAAVVGMLGPNGDVRGAKQHLLVDGKAYPQADVIGVPSWSPDGSRLAYIAVNNGEKSVMLDEGRLGPGSFFAFSPDSQHISHVIPLPAGPGGKQRLQLSIDGVPATGGEVESFLPGSRFVWESPTTVRIFAGRGNDVFLVRLKAP